MLNTLLRFIIKSLSRTPVSRTPAKNPLTGDTPAQRARESICRNVGCVVISKYYVGLPQAVCRRCGHRNKCAGAHMKEWYIPD